MCRVGVHKTQFLILAKQIVSESLPRPSPSPNRGRRECRVHHAHPQPRVQSKKAHELVTTGSPRHPGTPCANGFNGFLRALPGDRASCHRYLRNRFRKCDASVEASGPHDFAVRVTAHSSLRRPRPSLPAPNVRDDRETPLVRARDARKMQVIWDQAQSHRPAAHWHDGQITCKLPDCLTTSVKDKGQITIYPVYRSRCSVQRRPLAIPSIGGARSSTTV
jgi:hypothetical protein